MRRHFRDLHVAGAVWVACGLSHDVLFTTWHGWIWCLAGGLLIGLAWGSR